MDLKGILKKLENCPCGQKHTFDLKAVEIGSGVTNRAGALLREAGFGDRLLLVADDNTLRAAEGILPSLERSGFAVKKLIYQNLLYARDEQVREVESLCDDVDGILSVGTGSLNDICRVAAKTKAKPFCIFATAPSMDGFAADLAPIVANNFKSSWSGAQPCLILADTRILAKAPTELKAAGFGDMIAKYLGIFDWRVSQLLTGEHYCPAIAELTLDSVRRMRALADRVTAEDEEAAGAIMESLVLSGLAMKLAASSRPASGAEHALSHYWECYKLTRGIWPEFHGKKVGVASLLMIRIYKNIAKRVEKIDATTALPTLEEVCVGFDAAQIPEVEKLNALALAAKVDRRLLCDKWQEIRALAEECLPDEAELRAEMQMAGAATELADIHVDEALLAKGLRYHPYIKSRLLLTHLFPVMGIDPMDFIN
ncbi:MAG: sn-glycerol-1-phosphate dehydrogenase [Ruminococcaceae bacterium]|nr:sn-glycerol-1-phosphate dehydrogenase [Oscillospiraceae bacterium]